LRGGASDFLDLWEFLRGVLAKTGFRGGVFVVKTWWDAW
jgi:hypothetical protein